VSRGYTQSKYRTQFLTPTVAYNSVMEEISVEGENYVKASVLAARFGYTPDYLGQLCRGGQIKATLVGRSWYVNEDSLREHRQGRYRSTSAKSKESLRKMAEEKAVPMSIAGILPRSFKYEGDQDDLLPALSKKEQPGSSTKPSEHIINISAEAEKLPKKLGFEPNISGQTKDVATSFDKRITNSQPAPVFRTIPNFSHSPKVSTRVVPSTQPVERKVVQSVAFGGLRLAFLTFAIIMAETLVFLGSLGLEKRLVVPRDNSAMVLYGFDAKEIGHAFKDTFLR
jgi:hypothetical protein